MCVLKPNFNKIQWFWRKINHIVERLVIRSVWILKLHCSYFSLLLIVVIETLKLKVNNKRKFFQITCSRRCIIKWKCIKIFLKKKIAWKRSLICLHVIRKMQITNFELKSPFIQIQILNNWQIMNNSARTNHLSLPTGETTGQRKKLNEGKELSVGLLFARCSRFEN